MSQLRRSTFALVGLVLLPLCGVSAHAARALPKVFIEAQASPQNPYVQAATRVTVRLFSARALYHADLDLPSSTDVQIQQVGPDDRETVFRDGRSYDVLTREYLAFPQRSGKVSISGAVLSAQVLMSAGRPNALYHPGGALGGSPYGYGAMISVQPLVVHGASIVLHVRPRPAKALASYWVPARSVTLTSKWDPPSLQAHVGDALSLDMVIEANDLSAEQLPDLTALLAVPQGLKAYPDGPKLADSDRGNTLIGRREQSIALIASAPGRFTLPALELRWWDTSSNRAEEVSLPARTITVLPNRPGAAAGAGAGAATAAGGGA
ncbi:MAG: BatD family protein, partial [Steroidobacteraceae bacterium]